MALDYNKKLEINNIIDRLVRAGEEVFDPKDAVRLRDLVLVECGLKSASALRLHVTGLPQGIVQGHTSEIGNVAVDDGSEKTLRFGEGDKILCGNWEIERSNTFRRVVGILQGEPAKGFSLSITERPNGTRSLDQLAEYELLYKPDGEPAKLSAVVPHVWKLNVLGFDVFQFTGTKYDTFKLPAPSCAP